MTPPTRQIQSGYDRWAAVYDIDANPLQALETPIMRAAIGSVDRLNVLDLGCGTGRHSIWLADSGANVIAIDFSQGMLARARNKAGADKVRFISHDLHQPLPFESATFDLIVSGLVLEHLGELRLFFAEARRVLKSSGRAMVSAMHPAMFLRGTAARFADPVSGEIVQPGSIAHSISDFVLAALRGGFEISDLIERSPDESLAAKYPRAAKYVGWPMLVVMSLRATG